MDTFEYEGIGGYWWYAQLLIAEQKCTKPASYYKEYCEELARYLAELKSTKVITLGEAWGAYGTSSR